MPPVELAVDNEGKPKTKDPTQWHSYWQKEMDAAIKRQRKFMKQGVEVNQRFLDDRVNAGDSAYTNDFRGNPEQRLNLFHTNIVTLQAMLFGQTPKIEVTREYMDPDDDVARVAALMYQRMLEADTRPSGDDLGTCLRAALQDRLLPGLGVARVRYEAEFEGVELEESDPPDGEGEEAGEQMVDERCLIEYVHWQDCTWGWGRTFSELPWWGFRSFLTNEEATDRFRAGVPVGGHGRQ